MTDSPVRLCRDCAWLKQLAFCANPELSYYDIGADVRMAVRCDIFRNNPNQCGPEGKLWEPKP